MYVVAAPLYLPHAYTSQNSQSQRIFWLIEELRLASLPDIKLEYNLVLHRRIESGPQKNRAPPELAEIHPLGKAPQLVTPEGRVIVESSAIAKYLIDTYDVSNKFKGKGPGMDEIRDDMLTSFANASIAIPAMLDMFMEILVASSPFFIRPLFRATLGQVRRIYSGPELDKMFRFLNSELEGRDYFMGEELGRADFMLIWEIDFCTQRKQIDLSKPEYALVKAWHERIHSREGWKSAIEKGNGYNMAGF